MKWQRLPPGITEVPKEGPRMELRGSKCHVTTATETLNYQRFVRWEFEMDMGDKELNLYLRVYGQIPERTEGDVTIELFDDEGNDMLTAEGTIRITFGGDNKGFGVALHDIRSGILCALALQHFTHSLSGRNA